MLILRQEKFPCILNKKLVCASLDIVLPLSLKTSVSRVVSIGLSNQSVKSDPVHEIHHFF